jgi:DNA-binding transcriptional LysR family regulator
VTIEVAYHGVVNLRRLQYFSVVAHELHFRRAAEILGVAQPGLSQQIKVLEQELGANLFERGPHGVSLTPAGLVLLEEGVPLLGQLDRVEQHVRATVEPLQRELRVVHTRSVIADLPDEVVRIFRETHPRVRLIQDMAWTDRNLQMLRAGEVDVAFVRLPLADPGEIHVMAMGETELVAVLPKGHPLLARRSLDPVDLRDQPVVTWPRAQAPGYFDDLQARLWGGRSPQGALWEPDPEHILAAVAGGLGISVLDRNRALKLSPRGVAVRRFRQRLTGAFGVAWTSAATESPVAAFLTICRDAARA